MIAYPTDTVYGLGCDPKNKEAVQRLLEIKQRPVNMGLILLGASLDGVEKWLDINREQKEVIENEHAVPTTYLVPKTEYAPSWITGKHDSIAIRVTQENPVPFIHSVLGSPIVSTSANFHGGPELKSYVKAQSVLSGIVDLILEGPSSANAKPSRIIDILTNEVIRD